MLFSLLSTFLTPSIDYSTLLHLLLSSLLLYSLISSVIHYFLHILLFSLLVSSLFLSPLSLSSIYFILYLWCYLFSFHNCFYFLSLSPLSIINYSRLLPFLLSSFICFSSFSTPLISTIPSYYLFYSIPLSYLVIYCIYLFSLLFPLISSLLTSLPFSSIIYILFLLLLPFL